MKVFFLPFSYKMKNITLKTLLILLVFVKSIDCSGQDGHLSNEAGVASFGLGLGLNYGGIGVKTSYNIMDNMNLFLGLGYQIVDVGYNVGLAYTFASSRRADFYLSGMYGVNAGTKIVGLDEYDNLFTGPSFGMGIKLNSLKKEGNYWDFGILVPIRASGYDDVLDDIKSDPRVDTLVEPWPIQLFVGYNFKL